MKNSNALTKHKLLETLVATRQMTSLIDRELVLASGDIKRETVNWVPMWVDWGHAVRSDCNTATAIRAISDRAELLWYVRHDSKKHGYHSVETDPFNAFDDAMTAWAKRALVRAHWADVQVLARDLVLGRETFRVSMADAEQSALCTLGIKWFRDRMRIAHKPDISGRTAGLLMKVEPQLGFVIYEAALRTGVWARRSVNTVKHEPISQMALPGEQG